MGKPYCAEHLAELPYIARVMAEVAAGAADPEPRRSAPVFYKTGARWFGFEF